MTPQKLWNDFISLNPEAAGSKYEAWCYGSDTPDELVELTAKGIKTATASAYPVYEFENSPLPREGGYNIILLSDGSALCITKTIKVTVLPFNEVSAEHAFKEGEGDRSLIFWREVHKHFFALEMSSIGRQFTEVMLVVCEEFEVIYPILSS
jgi:uncharacterized protein YhfF